MTISACTIDTTDFDFGSQQQSVYHGKVRDVYDLGEQLLMVASDRISAFDHILPKAIPYKGQVLNQIAQHFLESTKDIVPNWFVASPDPNVSIGLKASSIKLEMVIRGYLSGHAWRTYKSGERILCGEVMPDGMAENDKFPTPLITPTTKASEGHDMDISLGAILHERIVTPQQWETLEKYTRQLFERGTQMAAARGLILVDTKYEFGIVDGEIILIDEIHTPDSSRYFYVDGYADRQDKGQAQPQLSKEFVREWLIAHDFQGLEGQAMPLMPDEFVWEISERYIQLYELITGHPFGKADVSTIRDRITNNVAHYLGSTL
jgi:phosphoribosylaminoimidazole-succinocarboxamide synthase